MPDLFKKSGMTIKFYYGKLKEEYVYEKVGKMACITDNHSGCLYVDMDRKKCKEE